MSNYPPGVSGFEPQIAGYDEIDDFEAQACRLEGTEECAYEGGLVEATIENGTAYWTCPECDTQNEENL